MKTFTLITAFIIFSFAAISQKNEKTSIDFKLAKSILNKQNNDIEKKSRALEYRLTKDTSYDYISGVKKIHESYQYIYPGFNGSRQIRDYSYGYLHTSKNEFNNVSDLLQSYDYVDANEINYYFPITNSKTKIIRNYDVDNKIINQYFLNFNNITLMYDTARSYFLYYSGVGNLDVLYTNNFDCNLFYKNIYTYNASNQNIELIQQDSNVITHVFENVAKETYSYNGNNLDVHTIQNYKNGMFVNISQEVYSYSASNLLLSIYGNRWDSINNAFILHPNQYTLFYDNQDRVDSTVFIGDNQFDRSEKFFYNGNETNYHTLYKYDKSQNGQKTIEYNYTFDNASNVVSSKSFTFDNIVNSWTKPEEEHYYYYESFNSPTNISFQESINNIVLYPNPTTHNMYASFDTKKNEKCRFEFVDIFGKIIKKESEVNYSTNHLINFDTKEFTNGIYLLNIFNENNFLQSLKFLKK